MAWFVTWGQKEGGISLSPSNHYRWLSRQRKSKTEYVFSFWWINQDFKQLSVKVKLLKPTTQKIYGCQIFFIYVGRFLQWERVLWGSLAGPSHMSYACYTCTILFLNKTILFKFWINVDNLVSIVFELNKIRLKLFRIFFISCHWLEVFWAKKNRCFNLSWKIILLLQLSLEYNPPSCLFPTNLWQKFLT